MLVRNDVRRVSIYIIEILDFEEEEEKKKFFIPNACWSLTLFFFFFEIALS